MANPHHTHNAVPRETWYPVSEASLPGLMDQLGGQNFDVRNAQTIPQAVKDWILGPNGLNPFVNGRAQLVLDEGSDRYWYYDLDGIRRDEDPRQWRMSVQHVELKRALTNRPRSPHERHCLRI